MLEDANRSADSAARALDFPSGSAFRNTCQRYLKATPQEIRAAGGDPQAARATPDEGPSFLEICARPQAWATFAGHFSGNYLWYFLITWLPDYLVKERGFTMSGMANVGAIYR